MKSLKWLSPLIICALMSACSGSPSPPLLTEPPVEIPSSSIAGETAPVSTTPSSVAITEKVNTLPPESTILGGTQVAATPLSITPLSITPTTVSPTRKPQTGLDVSDPALAQAIRAQVNEYHLAYFEEYLKLPNGDIATMTRFSAPNSDSERTIKEDAKNAKEKDFRARHPESDEVFILDIGRITLITPTRVRVTTCQANNLVAYYYGPPEEIVEDRLVTIIEVDDYVLLDGKWLEETQRSREQYVGQRCEQMPR
jgi:hypothetical protein